MNALDRYLLRQLGVSVIFVALTLTCAIWLTQSLRYVDYIINRGLSLGTFFYFTMLLMPSLLVIILPIALFISVLFVYNRLTIDRELVVMRVAGMGPLGLALPALTLALLVTLAGYAFNLYLLPVTFRQFKDMEASFREDVASVILQEGAFTTISDGLTVYVRARGASGELRGILAHDSRDPKKPVTYMAERGDLVPAATGPRVVMIKGNRQEMNVETGKVTLLFFDRYSVDLSLYSTNHQRKWREPAERFVHQLLWPGDSDADRYYRNQLIAEGHQRLAAPLLSIAFTLICLAGLLCGEFDRRGQARRVLATVVCIGAVQAASFGFFSLAAKHPLFIPLIYLNALLPMVLASYVLIKDPRWPRRRGEPADPAGLDGLQGALGR